MYIQNVMKTTQPESALRSANRVSNGDTCPCSNDVTFPRDLVSGANINRQEGMRRMQRTGRKVSPFADAGKRSFLSAKRDAGRRKPAGQNRADSGSGCYCWNGRRGKPDITERLVRVQCITGLAEGALFAGQPQGQPRPILLDGATISRGKTAFVGLEREGRVTRVVRGLSGGPFC
ncbi:hypothetical protein MRX96_020573 [Rhipicephalus microplus]